METAGMCPDCKTELPSDAPAGLCPRCLRKGMMPGAPELIAAHETVDMRSAPAHEAAQTAEADGDGQHPRHFDHYMLVEKIARGGLGVVFKARDLKTERVVALKMILAGNLASPAEVQRFRNEIEAAANLEHPNIVPIYDVGEFEQRPYYTMKLMAGSLAGEIEKFSDPRSAARLTATICWAIHFAHQRGVLHRDLKPHNILLDSSGNPHVSDFSLAKWVGGQRESGLTETGAVFGTPSYMAPEQASGQNKTITTAADVYAIGAILYELLTGRPPFQADSPMQTLRQVVECEPASPSSMGRSIDRDLETICLKCLEKEPSRRYGSAEDVGKELERYLKGQPIKARYIGRAQRVWRWCLRFPMWAASVAAAALFLVIITVGALWEAAAQQQALRDDAVKTNVFAARHVAGTVLWQLNHFSQAVLERARSPELRRLVASASRDRDAQTRLVELMRVYHEAANHPGGPYRAAAATQGDPFESWFVLDDSGIGLARWPVAEGKPWIGEDFGGREYFQEALRHAQAAVPRPHVSRVFQSHADGLYKFAISVPVKAADEPGAPVAAVLVTTITTGSTLGSVQLGGHLRKVVLVGPKDDNPRSAAGDTRPSTVPARRPPPSAYLVLFDGSYDKRDAPVPVTSAKLLGFSRRLEPGGDELRLPEREIPEHLSTDDDYADPNAPGRWLAGFAPVGNSELIVVVQTRFEDAIRQDMTLAKGLAMWLLVALFTGAAIIFAAAGYAHRKGMVLLRGERT